MEIGIKFIEKNKSDYKIKLTNDDNIITFNSLDKALNHVNEQLDIIYKNFLSDNVRKYFLRVVELEFLLSEMRDIPYMTIENILKYSETEEMELIREKSRLLSECNSCMRVIEDFRMSLRRRGYYK